MHDKTREGSRLPKPLRVSTLAFFRVALALTMIVAGGLHFVATDAYMDIMPAYLPLHRELVYLSGILEVLFGLGLLWRRTRAVAGMGLILLYIAVLPANINMALREIQPAGFHVPVFLLWLRVPFQLVLIYWAWRVSRPSPQDRTGAEALDTPAPKSGSDRNGTVKSY